MARLIKPDGDKIQTLCDERGWGAMELSAAADLAVATAAKVLRGKPCFRKTLKDVAAALGVQYLELLEGSPPEKKAEKRYDIKLLFAELKKKDFDEDRIISIAEKLNELIGGSGDIDMENIDDGSAILTLSLTLPDLLRLIAVWMENKDKVYEQTGATNIYLDVRITAIMMEKSGEASLDLRKMLPELTDATNVPTKKS